MAIIKSFAPFLNLSNFQTFLKDENPNSDYFRITEFKNTFTGGKNGFLIEGSPYLKETTEVKIEILDVEGNPVYYEPGNGIPEYYEGTSKLVSVHVYDDTPIGLGKITILGELKNYIGPNGETLPIPEDWKGVYNVKWEKTFQINKNINNEDIVRFYKRPQVAITELVKPIFSKTIPTVTDSGSVSGISQLPLAGTNINTYRGGTLYKLILSSGSWDTDVDENTITISSLNYSPQIIEVLNDREVLVETPYTSSNLVANFASESFEVTYSDINGQTIGESELTGSFAKIDITRLKTFVGDVARVKVFRKSRNAVGDFQFVQESKLESTELLRDVETTQDTELSYGRFDEYNLENYWVSSSVDHPLSINSSILSKAVKVDYDGGSGGVQKLITSQSFAIAKDVEYTLSLRTLLSGSVSNDKYFRAYFSGSYTNNLGNPASFTQSFFDITPDTSYNVRKEISENILSEQDINAQLVFEFKGDDWYVSNVSLKNAQETSFSPDEFTLIQDIPRKLASEIFDFRFEFYDINNNYIPVDVKASATFDGGNDYASTSKLFTFESDRNAFRFSSGSIGNPPFQQIQFKTTIQNITGSVTYASAAFDLDGDYIDPGTYSGNYPGGLSNITNAGALLSLANFSGSDETITVGSIVYTASIAGNEEFETVYRLEDGDNAPQLIVTSNANQFIYEPTQLSPKPSGQSITVRAQRKNLASLVTPITINSGSNKPGLNYISTTNGVDTYTISATQFSASFAANNFDEVTYQFTGSDVFGNEQTDEITLSKVINFDGVSVILSNESTTFPANSNGVITSASLQASSGSATVYVAGNPITFDDGLGKNTFALTNLTGTNCTPNGGQGSDPTTNDYGITAMTADSASLAVTVTYKAGDNATSQSFQKVVTYTKAKKASPVLSIETSNRDQSVTAKSTGVQIDSFADAVVTIKEQYEGSSNNLSLTSLSAVPNNIGFGSISTTTGTGTVEISSNTIPDGINTTKVAVSASVVDSEGVSRTLSDTLSLSKVRKAPPNVLVSVSPQSQNISSGSTVYQEPTSLSVAVKEASTNYTYGSGTTKFTLSHISGAFENTSEVITTTHANVSASISGSALVSYTDSEGTADSQIINFSIGVSVQGTDGVDGGTGSQGPPGPSGSDGGTGPGIVARGVWDTDTVYKFSTDLGDGLGRRDAVLWSRDGNTPYSTYYATLQEAGTSIAAPHLTSGSYWEELGQEDFFVAAKIAIFEDSFVKNTINVGTNASGSEANIAIVGGSTSPYITLGQSTQGYNNHGIFIGTDSTSQKMSLVGDSGALTWDGSNLNISGSVTITGGSGISNLSDAGAFATLDQATLSLISDAGAMAGIDQIDSGNASTYIGAGAITTGFIATNTIVAGNIAANTITTSELATDAIKSTNYSYSSGNFSTAGTFFDLTDGSITSQNFAIDNSGNAFYSGQVTAGTVVLGPNADGSNDGVVIDSNNYWVDGGSIRFRAGNSTNFFSIGNTGAIQANVATQGLAFYNSSDSAQGLAIGPYDVYITAAGTGNTQGKVSFGAGSIKGDVSATDFIQILLNSGGYLDITDGGSGGDLVVGGDIDADGNITAFASSDKKLKDNIIPISNALQKIIKIGGYEFDWNDKQKTYKGHDVGVIAQEVKKVLPEVVEKKKDGYLGVRYEKIVPLLIEGIKELTNKVEGLENEILKLKEKK